jgi:hypothetical protein
VIGNATDVTVPRLRRALGDRLAPDAARWLEAALANVATDTETDTDTAATALRRGFAEAGRRCGRAVLAVVPHPAQRPSAAVPAEALAWTVDDAARTLLLAAAPRCAADRAHRAAVLYDGGDAAERRGVLRALGPLDVGDRAVPLVADALRTNDPRLVAAALGPYAARHLDAHAWRHAVLKCLHGAIPLRVVAALAERADAELARMAGTYARELTSAGRPVPADVRSLAAGRPPGAAHAVHVPPPHPAES